jgi:uncharacterized membrane-anchored protein
MEIAQISDRFVDSDRGKEIDHIAWYDREQPGPGPDKTVQDIVTDDGTIYRWSRFTESELWTWQHRVAPDVSRHQTRHQLPSKVKELVERDDSTLYR